MKPFAYGFLKEDISKLCIADIKRTTCLNNGLATFAMQKHIEEIGVRRVPGASDTGILRLYKKTFIMLVAVSLIIAFSVAS
ncbi:MAG TPA: hypothetical protein VK369_08450 [Segetibacter sp.]|nr:hypothetical protein [Segetibacter sp.]